jgi:hypothetical protein
LCGVFEIEKGFLVFLHVCPLVLWIMFAEFRDMIYIHVIQPIDAFGPNW